MVVNPTAICANYLENVGALTSHNYCLLSFTFTHMILRILKSRSVEWTKRDTRMSQLEIRGRRGSRDNIETDVFGGYVVIRVNDLVK